MLFFPLCLIPKQLEKLDFRPSQGPEDGAISASPVLEIQPSGDRPTTRALASVQNRHFKLFGYSRILSLILLTEPITAHYLANLLSVPDPFATDPLEFHQIEYEEEKEPPPPPPDPSLIDLEDLAQDFVLETKRIEIPGYPRSFNPSIIRWKGSLLFVFRIRHPQTGSTNQIGFTWLDDDFNPIGKTYLLEVETDDPDYPPKQQDPRLVAVGERLYMVYSNILPRMDRETRRMYLAELQFDGERFFIENPRSITSFMGESKLRWEKNWVPFSHDGTLYLAYSIVPHRILRPILGTESCETSFSTLGRVQWDWGVLRGGTPALEVDGEYLSFFHSSLNMSSVHSQGKKIQHYVMGAYTFSLEPPFALNKISPGPIVGKNFYHGASYKTWKPLHVVFPCGYVFDEKYIWVVYGRQDHELWIAKLDKKGLMASLIPVQNY